MSKGDEVIPPINALIDCFKTENLPIFFTRDWHPRNHSSFKSHGGIWPQHAVKGTTGARFPSSLHVPGGANVISKATRPNIEAYSGFQGTQLGPRLRKLNVKELYVVGLATDYCVRNTVIDGMNEGFSVFLVTDCVKGVNVKRTDSATAFKGMLKTGARTTTSNEVLRLLRGRAAVSSSS